MQTPQESSATWNETWKKACATFEEKQRAQHPGRPIKLQYSRDLKNGDDMLRLIETKHKDFTPAQSREGKRLSTAVQVCVSPLAAMISMFGGMAGAAYPPASQILGAVTFVVNTAKATKAAMESLAELFDKLGMSTKRLDVLQGEREPSKHIETIAVAIMVCMLTILDLAARRRSAPTENDGIWHKVKAKVKDYGKEFSRILIWSEDAEINDAVKSLDRLTEDEHNMVTALTFQNTTVTRQTVIRIEGLAVHVEDLVQQTLTFSKETNALSKDNNILGKEANALAKDTNAMIKSKMLTKDDLKDELSTAAYEILDSMKLKDRDGPTKQQDVKNDRSEVKRPDQLKIHLSPAFGETFQVYDKIWKDRIKGSSDWILQEDIVKGWLECSHDQIVVVSGLPGSGKTFLAARMVGHLLSTPNQANKESTRLSAAYFFCKERLAALSKVATALKTVAYQLALNDLAYSKHILELARKESLPRSDISQIWKALFHDYFRKARGTSFVVVDAIDECDEEEVKTLWEAVNQWPLATKSNGPAKLRLFFTIRQDAASVIIDNLRDHCKQLALSASYYRADFRKFVGRRSRRAFATKMISASLMADIRYSVSDVADGNYLHASLTIERFASLPREDMIRKSIAEPPMALADVANFTLKHLMRNLSSERQADFEDILAWISCAQSYLTISQLDALLALRGNPSSRVLDLENLLRHEYSSLYIVSGEAGGSRTAKDLLDGRLTSLELREIQEVIGTHGPADEATTSLMAHDIWDESEDDAWEQAIESRQSVMSQATIRLEHGLLAQYIEKEQQVQGVIALNKDQMRCKILLSCLNVVACPPTSANEEDLGTAMGYCGLYLADHVLAAQPAHADTANKRLIANGILRLLRDEEAIDRWVQKGARYMTADLLSTDSFVASVRSWLEDSEVQSEMDAADREWVQQIVARPYETMFEAIARRHAKQWLTQIGSVDEYFEFINTYLSKITSSSQVPPVNRDDKIKGVETDLGPSLVIQSVGDELTDPVHVTVVQDAQADGNADRNNKDAPIDVSVVDAAASSDVADAISLTLNAVSAARIPEVARWAGLEETATWYARVGYALRLADHSQLSLGYFQESISLDPSNGVSHVGLARTLQALGETTKAIKTMLHAGALLAAQIRDETPGSKIQLEAADWMAHVQVSLPTYYRYLGQQASAIRCYEDLLVTWEEQNDDSRGWYIAVYGVKEYLQALTEWKLWDEAAILLERMIRHPRSINSGFLSIYTDYLYGDNAVSRVAYYSGREELADRFYLNGLRCIAEYGQDGQTALIRYSRAVSLLRLEPKRQDAVQMLKDSLVDQELLRAVDTNDFLAGLIKSELARKYMDNILAAREKPLWKDVGRWAHHLVSLLKDSDDADEIDTSVSTSRQDFVLTIAAWDRISGRQRHAKLLLNGILIDGVDMLSDGVESNDLSAWRLITNATLAMGDFDRSLVAINMSRLCHSAQSEDEQARDLESDHRATLVDENAAALDLGLDVVQSESAQKNVERLAGADSTLGTTDKQGQTADKANVEDNDTAAVSMNAKPMISPHAIVEIPKSLSDHSWFFCDGPCGDSVPNSTTIWRCSYCIADFCRSCHELIETGKNQRWGFCNATHEHIEFDGLKRKWPKGLLDVDGKWVPVREWLNDLMEVYGIEKKVVAVVPNQDETEGVRNEAVITAGVGVDATKPTNGEYQDDSAEPAYGAGIEEDAVGGASEASGLSALEPRTMQQIDGE